MNGVKFLKILLHRMYAIGLFIIFSISLPPLGLGAGEFIKIHYATPWSAGIDSIKRMQPPSPLLMAYAAGGSATQELLNSIVRINKKNEIDIAILNQNQWFKELSEGRALAAVAEMAPYLAVVNDDVFQKKNILIAQFLQTWQSVWFKTGYPYGVQPPEIVFLQKKYTEFSKGKGVVRIRDIRPFTKILIKERPVKFSPGKELVISRDYYVSAGIFFRSLASAKKGETYEGRIINNFR